MSDRTLSISRAKQAHRTWLTTGYKCPGFNREIDENRPAVSYGYVDSQTGYAVQLKANGAYVSAMKGRVL